MATLHLIDGEKGGVGKSWFATCVSEYLTSREADFYLVETDRSNPTTANRYKDKECYKPFISKCLRYAYFSEDEAKVQGADKVVIRANEKPTFVSLPSQAHRAVAKWMEKYELPESSESLGVNLLKWFICDGEDDSIYLAIKSIEHYSGQIPHVLVRNFGRCDDWTYFNKHSKLQETIKEHNVQVIDFPKLTDYRRIALNAKRMTFEEALQSADFNIMDKQDITVYRKKVFAVLESTGLLP